MRKGINIGIDVVGSCLVPLRSRANNWLASLAARFARLLNVPGQAKKWKVEKLTDLNCI